MKHIELRKLVAHEWQQEGRIMYRKIPTEDNESDILTKFVSQAILAKLSRTLGLRAAEEEKPQKWR